MFNSAVNDATTGRLHNMVLISLGILIAAGSASHSLRYDWQQLDWSASPRLSALRLLISVAPFSPLAASLLRLTRLRLMKRVALPAVVVIGVFGAILSFFFAGFSGAGGHIALLHGMTLTASVSASFLVLCRGEVSSSMIFPSFLILPALASAWSLFTGVVVAASASAISDGNPYCLASHGERKAVSSLAGLRGFDFYTTRTGYKDTQKWFFNGVLLVQKGDDRAVYNWSAARLRFDYLSTPWLLIDDPSKECLPRRNFLTSLPLF
jgi:hypothetical protein